MNVAWNTHQHTLPSSHSHSAYLSSGGWVGSPDPSLLPCTSVTTGGASPGVELPAVGCSELPGAEVSPTASSRVQEARLLVSMGEPSSWLLTAVRASESSALSGEREARRKSHGEVRSLLRRGGGWIKKQPDQTSHFFTFTSRWPDAPPSISFALKNSTQALSIIC